MWRKRVNKRLGSRWPCEFAKVPNRFRRPTGCKRRGFSITELLIVMAVLLVLAAITAPHMNRMIQAFKTRSSAASVSGLLSRARMRAVKDNKFYSVIVGVPLGNSSLQQACADLNYSGACDVGEPMVQFASGVKVNTAGGPSTALITCGSLGFSPCPSGYSGMNFKPEPAGILPSFTARGLPCVNDPPSTQPVWPGMRCSTTDQTQSPPQAVGFVYVLRNGDLGNSYAAVSITPAGRITAWMYRGRDTNGNDLWTAF